MHYTNSFIENKWYLITQKRIAVTVKVTVFFYKLKFIQGTKAHFVQDSYMFISTDDGFDFKAEIYQDNSM